MYTNITEIKHAEEEIRAANSKLEQANDLVTEKNKALEALVYQIVEISVAPGLLINILGLERGKNCRRAERS